MRDHHPGRRAGSRENARLCRPDATGGAGPLGRGRAMEEVYTVAGSAAVDNDLRSMRRGRGAEARRGRTTSVHLACTGTWYFPRTIAVTPAPRSPSSHHPRPAHKRPTRTRTAHRICLPAPASFAPSPSQHAHMSLTALLHPASTGTWRLRARPLAPYPRASLTTSPATSTRVREPDATPRALPAPPQSRCSLYLHPIRTRLAHDIPRRMTTDASPCGPSAPPAPRSFLLVPGPRRERKESLLRRPHLERRARTPHRGRLALALAPPAVAASSTARPRGRGALAWYPNRRPRTGTTRAACLCE
ncbi:hypothetical protein DFH09DRAFT_1364158 [Mycena vulgaris]|nr:hypothetical protein DFH09DRAFT_1364158 [Mycena vulgaris]